jgi:hypothetical protein
MLHCFLIEVNIMNKTERTGAMYRTVPMLLDVDVQSSFNNFAIPKSLNLHLPSLLNYMES